MGKYGNVYIAKTMQGLEGVLAKELKELGACRIKPGRRMVEFSGDMNIVYKANYWLRTALRILVPVRSFRAINEHQLYTETKAINWEKYLSLQHTFAVDSVVFSKYFNHSHYVALKVKDAIVDQFREKKGRRPSVDSKDPDIKINIYINIDRCTISLDSSGESLHKRGYRVDQYKAPLNEVLAAGLIMLSGWDKKTNFLDPMCGSGTFLIEAAMISRNIPPGYYRQKYS
jgi:putative N6-adenine-specific DNA methylase